MKPIGVVVASLLLIAFARAATWNTVSGVLTGDLVAVHGPTAVIANKDSTFTATLDQFDDETLGRIIDFLEKQPAASALWKDSTSKVARGLKGKLEVLQGGKLVRFDPADRPEPEFYVVYFGAFWCPPCRQFSPRFVTTYQRLQKLAPGRFETVFISSDRSSSEQKEYISEVGMPWPVLRYSSVGSVDVLERWAGRGIPCVVVVTRNGDLLYHSYHGEEYVGPTAVLKDFETLLRAERSVAAKRARHRLAVLQHLRAAAGATKPAAPYLVGLDLRKYQTLEAPKLMARIDLDERGRVTDVQFEPKQSAVIDEDLVRDASQWLFLPAIKDGHPVAAKALLPLALR